MKYTYTCTLHAKKFHVHHDLTERDYDGSLHHTKYYLVADCGCEMEITITD
jgi:hypothetical protein